MIVKWPGTTEKASSTEHQVIIEDFFPKHLEKIKEEFDVDVKNKKIDSKIIQNPDLNGSFEQPPAVRSLATPAAAQRLLHIPKHPSVNFDFVFFSSC